MLGSIEICAVPDPHLPRSENCPNEATSVAPATQDVGSQIALERNPCL
jgi:hypothetical protein